MSSTTSTSSSSSISTQYLNLLITQLQNQDPMDPMSNDQMTSVMTGLSELQQLESMNTSFASVLTAEQTNQATALIGKQITFTSNNSTAQASVDGVAMQNGVPVLSAGGQLVSLDDVQTISDSQSQ
jgi:flagellar basal-body rod modification protein FlgD